MAFSPAERMALALLRRSSISLLVSSIIFPIRITFSVAVCVSCAWEVAPCAISEIALSTCSTDSAVWEADLFMDCAASYNSPLPVRIFSMVVFISLRIRIKARAITPTSSFFFPRRLRTPSSRKSISAIAPTFLEIRIIGSTNMAIRKYAAIRNKSNAANI